MILTGSAAFAQTELYVEDFSGLSLPDPAPWAAPNWNGNDVASLVAAADGPEGLNALTRTTEVIGGRWYGGGLRGPFVQIPSLPADTALEDVKVSFWLKGSSSTGVRGPVGFSMISATGEVDAVTGAAYKSVPIAPTEWTQFNYTLAEMDLAIPGGIETPFDISSGYVQIYIWLRNDYETGWPTAEAEGIVYSISFTGLSITLEGEVIEPPTSIWVDAPVVDGLKQTGIGQVFDDTYPWVYSLDLAAEVPDSLDAGWSYIIPDGASLQSIFMYNFGQEQWLWTADNLQGWFYGFGNGEDIPAAWFQVGVEE